MTYAAITLSRPKVVARRAIAWDTFGARSTEDAMLAIVEIGLDLAEGRESRM